MKMTIQEAKQSLREDHGMELTVEFRVNFIGGEEETAYYTEDMADAMNTAIDMRG